MEKTISYQISEEKNLFQAGARTQENVTRPEEIYDYPERQDTIKLEFLHLNRDNSTQDLYAMTFVKAKGHL